jgi:cytidylate kinase
MVLPQADVKIYLDASLEARVERRYWQWLREGRNVTREQVRVDLEARDKMDRERRADPLKKLDEAWHVDTTGKSIDEVVEEIMARVREIKRENKE